MIESPRPGIEVTTFPRARGWKKHHKAQWLWQRWLAVVKFIDRIWPKNA